MHYTTLAAAVCALLTTTVAAYGSNKPACATKCWTNSQYVSPLCGDEVQCLCDDTEFQQAVYQCLYSQCQTAHFGGALHHTLSMCHDQKAHEEAAKQHKKQKSKEPVAQPTIPALIRNQIALERRQNGGASVSNSVTYSRYQSNSVSRSRPNQSVTRSNTMSRPMGSVTRSVTQSRNRPTQSVSNSAYRGGSSSRAMPVASQIPDGQVQAPAAIPLSMAMSSMQVVTQIGDGQVQAPAPTSSPIVQLPDGQPQATQGFMKRFDVRGLLGQL